MLNLQQILRYNIYQASKNFHVLCLYSCFGLTVYEEAILRCIAKNKKQVPNVGYPAYTAAPEIKNHLSYIPSIGAGRRSSCLLMLWEPGSTRSAECGTVTLALYHRQPFHLNQELWCIQRDPATLSLANDQSLPSLGTLTNNVCGISASRLSAKFLWRFPKYHRLFVFALAGESKLIFGFSVWDFVDTEPLICSPQEARKVTLHIFNVIEPGCQRIVYINDDYFPICFFLVKQCHDTQHLDLLYLAGGAHELANLADIKGIIITLGLGLWMYYIWVFPCLRLH